MPLAIDEDAAQHERASALVHVEHLLANLPLGLALVDRVRSLPDSVTMPLPVWRALMQPNCRLIPAIW